MACMAKNITSSGIIYSGKCEFYGMIVFSDMAADGSAIAYDALSATGNVLSHLGAAVEAGTGYGVLPFRVACSNGIYVTLAGANASCTVYYRPELSP